MSRSRISVGFLASAVLLYGAACSDGGGGSTPTSGSEPATTASVPGSSTSEPVTSGPGTSVTVPSTSAASTTVVAPTTTSDIQPAPLPVLLGQGDASCLSAASSVGVHDQTGMVTFIGTAQGKPIPLAAGTSDPETAARAFLTKCGTWFGIRDQKAELALMRASSAPDGRQVLRFQQVFAQVPVVAGELIVQLTKALDGVVSVVGEAVPGPGLSTTPKVSEAAAQAAAVADTAKAHGVKGADLVASAPALWVYSPLLVDVVADPSTSAPVLAWLVEVTSKGDVLPIVQRVFVDALSGTVVFAFNQVDLALDREIYDNNNDSSLGLPGTLARSEGGTASSVPAVNDAYDILGGIYQVYEGWHGRDSLDNAGQTLRATVRYCDPGQPCPYVNAYWTPSKQQIAIGQGLVTDDIIAHEYTHGVTSKESKLIYSFDSGAINEAFSDIWGEAFDQAYAWGTDGTSVNWQIGEGSSIGVIRNMAKPGDYGDPDKFTSPNYVISSIYVDYGGVHTNSGVANKAYYLLIGDNPMAPATSTFNGQTVTNEAGLNVLRVFYEAQTNLLTSGANYRDLGRVLGQACENLVGTGPENWTLPTPAPTITWDFCLQVRRAVRAVEMNHVPVSVGAGGFIVNVARKTKGGWVFGTAPSGSSGNVHVFTGTATAVALTGDSTVQTLLTVPGLGGIRDTGDPAKKRKLVIFSSGSVVEYSLWYQGTYTQGEVPTNGAVEIDIPHYLSFDMSIARPGNSKIAWLFGRENDNQLVALTYTGTSSINVGDSTVQNVLSMPGIATVKDTGNSTKKNTLVVKSNGEPLTYVLWSGSSAVGGSVAANASVEVAYPHYQSFVLVVRGNSASGWVFGRENDNQLVAVTKTSSTSVSCADATGQTLLSVTELGTVEDRASSSCTRTLILAPRETTIYDADVTEWSVWWMGGSYTQGELVP